MPSTQPSASKVSISSVSLYDARPFFEKALNYGVQHGLIDSQKLDAICADAPKGMVQIARYFGNEFLRPELEKAMARMVNLVSLYLEDSTQGDLHQAAESLRDYSFLSRSKGGSDMLKAMIAMPQNSHFGMSERNGFTDEHIPVLAKWSLRSLADYQAELAQRRQVALVTDAAIWLAAQCDMDAAELEEAGKDAEAVIRTALLLKATSRTQMPDWIAFEKMLGVIRKKYGAVNAKNATNLATQAKASELILPIFEIELPKNLPKQFVAVVEAVRQTVLADVMKILDPARTVHQLFNQTPAFIGRYFWTENALSEVDNFDRLASAQWHKVTTGNTDDSSLLTLFLCVAVGVSPKTILTEKSAATLIRKIHKAGEKSGKGDKPAFNPELVFQYILDNAPVQYQDGYAQLWSAFVEEAEHTLNSDAVNAFNDAMALLRRECNIKQA